MFKKIKLLNKIVKDNTGKDICPCCKNKCQHLIHVDLSLYVCKQCLEEKKPKVDKMLNAEKTIRESFPESIANAVLGRKI